MVPHRGHGGFAFERHNNYFPGNLLLLLYFALDHLCIYRTSNEGLRGAALADSFPAYQ